MGLDKTTFGERAWVLAFAEMNSSKVKEYGAVLSSDEGSIMRLSDYMLSGKNMELIRNLQSQGLDADVLDRIYVLTAQATKGEFKGNGEIELIINTSRSEHLRSARGDYYKDIGVITYDESSKEDSFILDSKIREDIDKALREAVDDRTKAREFDIDTLDKLVETLMKEKNLCPQDRDEVRRRVEEAVGTVDEARLSEQTEQEKADEENGKKIIGTVPEGETIETYMESKGMALGDVKQVTTVKDASALKDYVQDNSNIDTSVGAEPVVLVSVRNKEANTKSDRIITVQGNRVSDDRANDSKINDFKEKNGKDSSVISKTYPEEEKVRFGNSADKSQEDVIRGADKNTIDLIQQELLKIQLYREQEIREVLKNEELTPEEKQSELERITGQAYGRVVKLESSYGVELDQISRKLFDEATQAAKGRDPEIVQEIAAEEQIEETPSEEEEKQAGGRTRGGRVFGPKNDIFGEFDDSDE